LFREKQGFGPAFFFAFLSVAAGDRVAIIAGKTH
jgi:hypothetical protein